MKHYKIYLLFNQLKINCFPTFLKNLGTHVLANKGQNNVYYNWCDK